MNSAMTLHFVLAAALVAPGIWLVTRGRLVLGWVLSILGAATGLMGIFVPILHQHLHH